MMENFRSKKELSKKMHVTRKQKKNADLFPTLFLVCFDLIRVIRGKRIDWGSNQ